MEAVLIRNCLQEQQEQRNNDQQEAEIRRKEAMKLTTEERDNIL